MHPLVAVPAIVAVVYRAYSHRSLTAVGCAVAAVTAGVHALSSWSVFFALLLVFFVAGMSVTKVRGNPRLRLRHPDGGQVDGLHIHFFSHIRSHLLRSSSDKHPPLLIQSQGFALPEAVERGWHRTVSDLATPTLQGMEHIVADLSGYVPTGQARCQGPQDSCLVWSLGRRGRTNPRPGAGQLAASLGADPRALVVLPRVHLL